MNNDVSVCGDGLCLAACVRSSFAAVSGFSLVLTTDSSNAVAMSVELVPLWSEQAASERQCSNLPLEGKGPLVLKEKKKQRLFFNYSFSHLPLGRGFIKEKQL